MQRLRENRLQIDRDLSDPERRRRFSPTSFAVDRTIAPAIRDHAHGKLIDVGCGDMPYRSLILTRTDQYDTLDVERRVPGVKFVSDIHDMSVLADESYDTAVCLEVLEHVRDPFQALREIRRILRPGGTFIVSVPHLSRLHEEPHDYYRYTKHGLAFVLDNAGFEVRSIAPSGGLFCFLGHQLSTLWLGSIWHVPVLKELSFFLNYWLCVRPCVALDDSLDKAKVFAMGYTAVATKR